ncbi:MAG TPA: serine/threonine-protein kinase [Ignavibacteriaceae bacterium]|nr:serine/threonine-protein kinase [Ignavibacteriaceae bacterium]
MLNTATEVLFKKFEIIETLKKDAYTAVYIAVHTYLGKKIILKTLNTRELSDKTVISRFRREAKILAKLSHPNLIEVLDFGTYENYFYLSFEYFESRNLREIIKENKISLDEKLKLLDQLLQALEAAHQNQVVHRDIKPENILVNSKLQLKIADFGLALILNETNLTQKSSIVGTPSYMSPEQIRGEILSTQSDLFSTGIVAYELFTGRNPFVGKDISETINKILNFDEHLIARDIESLPVNLQKAIKLMLKRNPKSRAATVNEVYNLLGFPPNKEQKIYKRLLPSKTGRKKIFAFIAGAIIIFAAAFFFFSKYGVTIKTGDAGNSPVQNHEVNKTVKPGGNSNTSGNNNTEENKPAAPNLILDHGKLFIECSPWGDVYVDNNKVDTTPLKDYIRLKTGRHTIKVVHPDYPPYVKNIKIAGGQIETIVIDFKYSVGYLMCNINPWGDVYINNELKGTTPLRSPILLYPGKYTLTVTNPQYGKKEVSIEVKARDTINYNFNFEIRDSLKDSL